MYSYTFFCQTAALGVFFEYTDYIRFIEKTHEYKSIPNPILPSLKLLGTMACFIVVIIISGMYIPIAYCWSEEYAG